MRHPPTEESADVFLLPRSCGVCLEGRVGRWLLVVYWPLCEHGRVASQHGKDVYSPYTFDNRFVSFFSLKAWLPEYVLDVWFYALTLLPKCLAWYLFRMGLSTEWTGGGRVRLTEHVWLKHSRIKWKEMMRYLYGVGFWFLSSCPSSPITFKGAVCFKTLDWKEVCIGLILFTRA